MPAIFKRGFTLIELLITISIIGILAAVGMQTFSGSQKRARDARRQSDLNQYRVALENYASVRGGVYPNNNANGNASLGSGVFGSGATAPLNNFLDGRPTDPKQDTAAGYDYFYRANSSGTSWTLTACMESGTNRVYRICSTGKAGIKPGSASCETDPSITTCDL